MTSSIFNSVNLLTQSFEISIGRLNTYHFLETKSSLQVYLAQCSELLQEYHYPDVHIILLINPLKIVAMLKFDRLTLIPNR